MKPKDFTVDVNCPECNFEMSLPFEFVNTGCSVTIDYVYNPWGYCTICNEKVNVFMSKGGING